MFKVITMSDSKYFSNGSLFLKTRNKIPAEFILYGPDLTDKQIRTLKDYNIEYKQIDKNHFYNEMQLIKFYAMSYELKTAQSKVAFIDFDTFFVKDFTSEVFDSPVNYYDIGITANFGRIRTGLARGYANGGVIFANHSASAISFFDNAIIMINMFAKNMMSCVNEDSVANSYDEIFKTIEDPKRPVHKQYHRNNLSWWCDQIYLSAIIDYQKKLNVNITPNKMIYHYTHDIKILDCNTYNMLDVDTNKIKNGKYKNAFICHLKNAGRQNIEEINSLLKKDGIL